MMHLIEGGDMASIPDPVPGEGQPVDVSVPAAEIAPAPPDPLTQELDATWDPNQKYMNNLCLDLSNALSCQASSQGVVMGPTNLKQEKIYLTYGVSIYLVGDSIQIDLGNEDYNMLLAPSEFSLTDAVKHIAPHIQSVVKQQKLNASTSPF